MDPRSIGVRCGSTAILPLVGKAGVQSSAGQVVFLPLVPPGLYLVLGACMGGRFVRLSHHLVDPLPFFRS